MYICIFSEELDKSVDYQDVDWNLCIEHASSCYADMIYIAIIGNYQAYSVNGVFLGGQSLSCFQRDCGGSELYVLFVADYCGDRIVNYKWNYVCIRLKGIFIGLNCCGKSLT